MCAAAELPGGVQACCVLLADRCILKAATIQLADMPHTAARSLACLPPQFCPHLHPVLQVGSIINFAAVYLLAPVPAAPGGAAALSFVSKVRGTSCFFPGLGSFVGGLLLLWCRQFRPSFLLP